MNTKKNLAVDFKHNDCLIAARTTSIVPKMDICRWNTNLPLETKINRKYIGIIFCISFSAFLWASPKYTMLDGFRDVEIIDITPQGIHIVHRSGACVLTEKQLSEAGRELLKSELQELHRLQEKHKKQQKESIIADTARIEHAIQSAELADNPEVATKILESAETKFKLGSNRDRLRSEIDQKRKELKEYHEKKLDEARDFLKKKDHKKAFALFYHLGNQGNAKAQFFIGVFYGDGLGVPKDDKLAFQWFYKSANQEYSRAQHSLASLYINGRFVRKDEKEAFNWYMKAARQKRPESQFCIAMMYKAGLGIDKNYAEAFKWFQEAAKQGFPEAQLGLGEMYYSKDGGENYPEAVKWFQLAADQDETDAMVALAQCYESGKGVMKNEKVARRWYEKAASKGNRNALNILRDKKIQELEEKLIPRMNASAQERKVARYILDRIASGSSVEAVFDESALKRYARESLFIYRLLVRLLEYERNPCPPEFILLSSPD